MNVVAFSECAASTTRRMIMLLQMGMGAYTAEPAPTGLPSGSIYLREQKMILASSPCRAGVFNDAMRHSAQETGADIILAHQGRYPVPGILDDVSFSALVHVGRDPLLIEDMVLFWTSRDGFWLLPSGQGPCIALNPYNPRISHEPPFQDCYERAAGVSAAAKRIIRTFRYMEAF